MLNRFPRVSHIKCCPERVSSVQQCSVLTTHIFVYVQISTLALDRWEDFREFTESSRHFLQNSSWVFYFVHYFFPFFCKEYLADIVLQDAFHINVR